MLTAELGAAAAKAGSMPATLIAMSAGGISIDFDRSVLLQMVVFLLLVVALKPLLFDPVLKVFEERERRNEGYRAEARRMQEEAGELLQRYERALDRVRQVASEERERIRVETAKLEAEILAEAQESTKRILEEGRREMEADVNAKRFELGKQSEKIASEMASRLLGREVWS